MRVRLWILTCWFMLTCVSTASAQETPPRGFRIKLGPKVEATKTRGAVQDSKKAQKPTPNVSSQVGQVTNAPERPSGQTIQSTGPQTTVVTADSKKPAEEVDSGSLKKKKRCKEEEKEETRRKEEETRCKEEEETRCKEEEETRCKEEEETRCKEEEETRCKEEEKEETRRKEEEKEEARL